MRPPRALPGRALRCAGLGDATDRPGPEAVGAGQTCELGWSLAPRRELAETIEFARWIHETDPTAEIGLQPYTPYPGTPLYEEAVVTADVTPVEGSDTPYSRWGDWFPPAMAVLMSSEFVQERLGKIYPCPQRSHRSTRFAPTWPGVCRTLREPFTTRTRG